MTIHDLHTHSTFSDGDATPEQIVEVAAAKDYRVGIADHVFCGQLDDFTVIEKYCDTLRNYPVWVGVEANIGDLTQWPDRLAGKLDYIIASVHRFHYQGETISLSDYFGHRCGHRALVPLHYDKRDSRSIMEDILREIEQTFRSTRVEIFGHGTVSPFYEDLAGSEFLDDWEQAVVGLCQKYRVAIEISGLWKEPGRGFLQKALAAGLQFSLGSDCHRFHEICNLEYSLRMLEELPALKDRMFEPVSSHR